MQTVWWKKTLSVISTLAICGGLLASVPIGGIAAAGKVIKIACVGDSITAGSGSSSGNSYPDQLGRLLGSGFEVKNFGRSGTTAQDDGRDQNPASTTSFGYRHTDAYRNSLDYGADIVILMMGTNDSKPVNWKDGDNKFEEDWKALLQSYLDLPQHPTVVVATPCTVFKSSFTISDEAVSGVIAPLERRLAAEKKLPLVDINTLTKGHSEYFTDDGVHPNDTGYGVLAAAMPDMIRQLMISLEGFTLRGAVGIVDNENDTVTVTLPAAADITALEPVLTLPEGATYAPAGPQDFTSPVVYTITAANGVTTRDYTVTVKRMDTVKVACVGDSMTAAPNYPNLLEELLGAGYEVGRFGVNSTTVQKTGLKENGQNPVSAAYTDHGEYRQSLEFRPDIVLLMLGANDSKQGDGREQWGNKLVTNWTEDSPARYEADLTELVRSYQALDTHPAVVIATSPSGYTTADNWAAMPEIVNSQIAPIQRKVAAELGCFLVDFNGFTQGKENELIGGDGLHPNDAGYRQLASAFCEVIMEAQAAVTGFSLEGETGLISQIDKTIYVTMPDGTDLTDLTPTVTLAPGAVANRAGPQNFGRPVTYTVTAANGHARAYTVTVTSPSGVQIARLELQTPPVKTRYLQGERLDPAGAQIDAVYTDGARERIDVTEEMVSGYDWLSYGRQEVTVNYGGKTTTFSVQVTPYGLVGSFSAMNGKAHVLRNGDNLLYADWKWADKYPLNLSRGGDRSDLSLELDVTFGSEQEVDPADLWQRLTVKLRSTDVLNKNGDPDLPVNGGHLADNAEHNYGWDLPSNTFSDPGSIHLSIPLDTPYTNKRGLMDWSQVGRIIILGLMKDKYRTDSMDHYMDIQNVYIIDNSQKPTPPDTAALQAAVDEAQGVDTEPYTEESTAKFAYTLSLARAYLSNPYASEEDIGRIIRDLEAARAALTEIPSEPAYTPGDVDGDGKITSTDARLVLQLAVDKITESDLSVPAAADVDGDGAITSTDARLILQYSVGKIKDWP